MGCPSLSSFFFFLSFPFLLFSFSVKEGKRELRWKRSRGAGGTSGIGRRSQRGSQKESEYSSAKEERTNQRGVGIHKLYIHITLWVSGRVVYQQGEPRMQKRKERERGGHLLCSPRSPSPALYTPAAAGGSTRIPLIQEETQTEAGAARFRVSDRHPPQRAPQTK